MMSLILDTFKAIVRSMSDDAYTSVGSLVCIYLKLYEKLMNDIVMK